MKRCDDEDEPLLPLHLIVYHILPFAFDSPAQAAQLCLVCSACSTLTQQTWFWTPYLMTRRADMKKMVEAEVLDEQQKTGLLRTLETSFSPKDFLRVLGEKAVTMEKFLFRPSLNLHDRNLLEWVKKASSSPLFSLSDVLDGLNEEHAVLLVEKLRRLEVMGVIKICENENGAMSILVLDTANVSSNPARMVLAVRQICHGDRNCSVFCGMVRKDPETAVEVRDGPGWFGWKGTSFYIYV